MDKFFAVKSVLLVTCLAIALYYDVKEQKIKNFITFPVALAGVLINSAEQGNAGLLLSIKGWLIPIMALMILYYINIMGAGDIKLYGAIGAVMGWPFAAYSFLYSIYFGALIALVLLIRRKQFLARMKHVLHYFNALLITRRLVLYTARGDKSSKFIFTTAIVPGTLVHLFFQF